jgi:2'-5' RNA ligase
MYLITAYFDEKTNKRLQHLIDSVAKYTGNHFMTENHVPPHITISAFEARTDEIAIQMMENVKQSFKDCNVHLVSVGVFLPYVIYVAPIYNAYLQDISCDIYDTLCDGEDIIINQFYKPTQWFPHITIGKKLSKEEMQIAFRTMQEQFQVMEGRIVRMGLSKPNPHRDLITVEY